MPTKKKITLISILFLIIFELFFFYHSSINPAPYLTSVVIIYLAFVYVPFVLSNLILITLVKNIKKDWNTIISPGVLMTSTLLFSIFTTNTLLIHSVFILSVFYIYFYFSALRKLKQGDSGEAVGSYRNILICGNFLALFFITSSIYGLRSFISVPMTWLLPTLVLAFVAILFSLINGFSRINTFTKEYPKTLNRSERLRLILFSTIALSETAWVTSLLPFDYITDGLLVLLCYYINVGILERYVKDNLDKKIIRLYFTAGIIGILLIVITTRWR
ncbi:MAG: hypothetical protein NT091_00855 [Candidatus Falkowbacteria bacterium]|nr:hypothetical protein [Candidatus Falkowbacteria bacterium]